MQTVMNLKVKFREAFRPFAPCVLREHVARVLRHAAGRGQPLHAARRAGATRNARLPLTDEAEARSTESTS